MGKILQLKRRRTSGPGGGGPPRDPPSAEEIRATLRAVEATLKTTHQVLDALEKRHDELELRLANHSKYILTIVRALLRAGVDVPLTSKDPKDT
jgi:septal ring factor EnvC (AmiA/AmiB activator)